MTREISDFIVDENGALVTDAFDDSVIDLERRNEFANSTDLLRFRRVGSPMASDDYYILLPVSTFNISASS